MILIRDGWLYSFSCKSDWNFKEYVCAELGLFYTKLSQ